MLDDVTQRRDGVGLVPRSSAPGQCRFDTVSWGQMGTLSVLGRNNRRGRVTAEEQLICVVGK